MYSGIKYIRLKNSKDEHDDEEEDVGGQDRHLIDGFVAFFDKIHSVCRRKEEKDKGFNQEMLIFSNTSC